MRAILTAALMANETVEENPQQLDDASVWTTTPEGERIPNYDATWEYYDAK